MKIQGRKSLMDMKVLTMRLNPLGTEKEVDSTITPQRKRYEKGV